MADIDIKRAHNMGIKAARAAADKMGEQLFRSSITMVVLP